MKIRYVRVNIWSDTFTPLSRYLLHQQFESAQTNKSQQLLRKTTQEMVLKETQASACSLQHILYVDYCISLVKFLVFTNPSSSFLNLQVAFTHYYPNFFLLQLFWGLSANFVVERKMVLLLIVVRCSFPNCLESMFRILSIPC